jgi:hypothetical protein
MVDRAKRHLCRGGFLNELAVIVAGFREGMAEAQSRAEFDRFFETDESCYALVLAYPDDLLLETARLHGIPTEGRERKEIVKALFLREGGHAYRF